MRFEIDWHDTSDGVPCTTLASIALLIDGTPIWPVTDGEVSDFEWFADELLAHITECWKPLVLRQTYPIMVQPERPSFLMAELTKRWSELPDAAVESERQEITAFEDVHNLANAFGGVSGLLPYGAYATKIAWSSIHRKLYVRCQSKLRLTRLPRREIKSPRASAKPTKGSGRDFCRLGNGGIMVIVRCC